MVTMDHIVMMKNRSKIFGHLFCTLDAHSDFSTVYTNKDKKIHVLKLLFNVVWLL